MKKKLILSICILGISLSIVAQTKGTLEVSTTTSSTGGNFAPKHITAIWVETASGTFVKTLLAYADKRITHLNTWETSTSDAGSMYNRIDAITGATRTSHGIKSCTWNGTDVSGTVVDDGTYLLKMELTDKNSTGNISSFSFIKGTAGFLSTPQDQPSFSATSIKWTPEATSGVADQSANQLIIYPNPTTGLIQISGSQIQSIEILDLLGKRVYSGTGTSVDLSDQPKGIYMVIANFSTEEFLVKKVILK